MLKKILLFSMLIFVVGCEKKKTAYQVQQDSIRKELEKLPLDENGRIAKVKPYPEPLPDSIYKRELANAMTSPKDLFQTILIGINKNDVELLKKVLVSESEYKRWLWHEFAESRPIMNYPPSLAWQELQEKSGQGLNELLYKHANKQYTLDSLKFVEPIENYQTFRFLRGVELKVKTKKGESVVIDDFGSVLELNGKYKLLSFGN